MSEANEHQEKVSDDTFWRIYGSGKKRGREAAEAKEYKLDIGEGVKMPFSFGNFAELQTFVTSLVNYHGVMREEIDGLKAQLASLAAQGHKPRIRVPAGSVLQVVEPTEVWKPVPGADRWFECSPEGKFRDTRKPKKAINVRSVNSISQVTLTKTSKFGNRQTVILNAAKAIAEAFCTKSPDLPVLHFRDGSRFNITAQNMVWIRENDPRRAAADFSPIKRRERPAKTVWGATA